MPWVRKSKRSTNQKEKLVAIMHEARQAGCVKCGKSGKDMHPACLDFHHRDPSTKSFHPNEGVKMGVSIDRMMAELEKCDCICKFCHTLEHTEHLYEWVED